MEFIDLGMACSRMTRIRTPDSFNKHAPPGTSLFDGTEATPQRPDRRPGSAATQAPRARRRIAFGPAEIVGALPSYSSAYIGGQKQAKAERAGRRATEDGSAIKQSQHLRRRSKSLSPRAVCKAIPCDSTEMLRQEIQHQDTPERV